MYKLDLPVDQKEASSIERRRFNEEQRKSRIFNSKTRQIGIDCLSLDNQIKDKIERKYREKEISELYDVSAIRNDKISELMKSRQDQDSKELQRAINEFRFLHQKANDRREFNLYDKNALKKDKPARVCDNDPRCTISGLQKFDGEDLNEKYRKEHQKNCSKIWLDFQIKQREKIFAGEKKSKDLYDLKQLENDLRLEELTKAKEECQKAINLAIKNYNLALMNERNEKDRLNRQQIEDDNRTHIINCLTSDLLTENPDQAISAFGPNRVLPDRFKGMSSNQLQDILKTQQDQINEKKRLELESKRIEDEYQRQQNMMAKQAVLFEREMERLNKMKQKQLVEENVKLSKDHKLYIDHINNEVYTNQPTAAYFMQFNTCTR